MTDTLIQAIAREEGFNVVGSRAQRNNNPGNLDFKPWQLKYGAVLESTLDGEKAVFAKFPTAKAGFDALRELLTHYYTGLTIRSAIYKFAPPTENHTDSYITNICSWMAAEPSTVLLPNLIG